MAFFIFDANEHIELYEIYKQYPNIQTDTRKLQKDDLFFALKGPNFNANAFAEDALAAAQPSR